jgi:hypothetical protein
MPIRKLDGDTETLKELQSAVTVERRRRQMIGTDREAPSITNI